MLLRVRTDDLAQLAALLKNATLLTEGTSEVIRRPMTSGHAWGGSPLESAPAADPLAVVGRRKPR